MEQRNPLVDRYAFPESQWLRRWSGDQLRPETAAVAISEIFTANFTYWNSLTQRIIQAVRDRRMVLRQYRAFQLIRMWQRRYLRGPSTFLQPHLFNELYDIATTLREYIEIVTDGDPYIRMFLFPPPFAALL